MHPVIFYLVFPCFLDVILHRRVSVLFNWSGVALRSFQVHSVVSRLDIRLLCEAPFPIEATARPLCEAPFPIEATVEYRVVCPAPPSRFLLLMWSRIFEPYARILGGGWILLKKCVDS